MIERSHSKFAAGRDRLCTAFLACAAFACSPAFACGFHDQSSMLRGMMNWVYPDSLHVGTAVWVAQRAGRLTVDRLAERDELTPEARNRFGYVKATFQLRMLKSVLADARGAQGDPNLAVLLLGPMLWSRYQPDGNDIRLDVHVDGPRQGDVVVVTEAEVVAALVHGRLSGREAIELGLVKFYGEAARSKKAGEWLSAIML